MKAVFSNLLALTLVASHVAPVALAAPVSNSSKEDKRSLKAVGTAIAGGIASGAAGAIVSDLLNKREPEPESEAHEARSLKAVGAAVAGGIASGAAGAIVGDLLNKRDAPEARSITAIENFFSNLFNKRSEPSGLMVDTETGIIYMDVPDANEGRSLKAIGTAIAGGVASLATGAVVNNLLGNKRSESSGLMVDTETGIIYMDVPDANEGRSLKAVGTAIAGGVASLAAGAVVSNLLDNKRSEASGLMVDTETGVIYMDVPDANEGRSLKAIGTAIAGGAASLATGAIVNDLLNKRDSGLLVDTETGTIYADVPDAPEARSLTAIENFFGSLFNKRSEPSGLMVDTETGVIYMDVPDSNEGRSLKAIGTAIAGGIASGAAGAIVSDLLNKRSESSGIFVDTETGTLYMDVPDANEVRSLKAIGTAIAGGIASGAAGAIVSDLLNKRESGLLYDTETGTIFADIPDAPESRSLKAVGTAIAGGIASGAAGAIVSDLFNKRSESGLLVDTETGVLYMDIPDANESRSLKAVGTAIAGGIASGAAGALVSDLLNKRDAPEARSLTAIENFFGSLFNKRSEPSGLMVDTETGVIYMNVPDANEGRSLKAIGTAIAGGIASGAAGAIVSDLLNKRSDLSGLMVDTETGTIFMDIPDSIDVVESRSLKAIGTAVAGGIASGAAGAIVSDLLNKRAINELD